MPRMIDLVVPAIIAMVVIGLLIWWYKFADCQAVGHSTLYCVGKIVLG